MYRQVHIFLTGFIGIRSNLFLLLRNDDRTALNPFSPSIQIQTLQTDLHTFPARIG